MDEAVEFFGEMEAVVPWARLAALIDPYYTKPRKGRPQMSLSVMLRIYFLQQWYSLSDPTAKEALYDMRSMRNFVGLDLAHDAIPDETTILNFIPIPRNSDSAGIPKSVIL